MRQAAGNSVETRADGFHRQLENPNGAAFPGRRATIAPGNARRKSAADIRMMTTVTAASAVASNENGMEILGQRLHAQPEHAGNFFQMQAEEIFHLRAGDQDGDAVGEADDDGTRNVLHRRCPGR